MSDFWLRELGAWIEREVEARNDWVNREMYGREVEPDPDVVVRRWPGPPKG